MSLYGYRPLAPLEMHRIEPSRRARYDDYPERRQYEQVDGYSRMPIQSVTPRTHVDDDPFWYHTAPRIVGQQLPDFVLFPPVKHNTGKKRTRLGDNAVENVWGTRTAVARTSQVPPPPSPSKHHGRRTSGTHIRTPRQPERDIGERTPETQDQWDIRHPSKSRLNMNPPPNAPMIPRLSTPEFDDIAPNQGSYHGFGFCACCPREDDDAVLSRWRQSKTRMDKQSKFGHPVFGLTS